jgi:hypothetical protein
MGFSEDTAISLAGAVPTVRPIGSLADVEESEYDLLVVRGNRAAAAKTSLYTIVFEDASEPNSNFGPAFHPGFGLIVLGRPGALSRVFDMPAELDPRLARLIRTTILPRLLDGAQHSELYVHTLSAPAGGAATPPDIDPWITDSAGRIVAGSFLRSDLPSRCWCVPGFVDDPVPWVVLAREIWSQSDPVRFPSAAPWSQTLKWLSSEELTVRSELTAFTAEREGILRRMEAREDELSQRLQLEKSRADNGIRRLLTAQGDDLKEAVAHALRQLGFTVVDVDVSLAKPGELLEDLQVAVEGDDWICLAEVRGYDHGGGKTSDLARIDRFRNRFALATGQPPDRTWYVVNHFAASDPATRPMALAASSEDVEIFGESRGAIIESRLLFDMLADVDAGRLQTDEARTALREAQGRLVYERRAPGL